MLCRRQSKAHKWSRFCHKILLVPGSIKKKINCYVNITSFSPYYYYFFFLENWLIFRHTSPIWFSFARQALDEQKEVFYLNIDCYPSLVTA